MQIIENNYSGDYEIDCPRCNSKLKYNDGDIWTCDDGSYVRCPCCTERIYIDDSADVTPETIHYPETFYSFANAVAIKSDEINKWVKECVSQLDKDTDYTLSASGDTIVFAYKSDWDDGIASVVVAKKYQECDVKIPRENF